MSFHIGDFKTRIDSTLLRDRAPGEREDGRRADALRPVVITPGFSKHAEGSALIEVGETKVICTVSVEERVPRFLKGKAEGWITSEYGMLPRATSDRTQREATRGRASGRTCEIQRLIGRALRAVVDLKALGERTLWVDCDVIQADGGTRTASITGAFVALAEALKRLEKQKLVVQPPLLDFVAATSVGKIGDNVLLDLTYREDASAEVDMNIVKTGGGRFVEIQGTAEGRPFDTTDLHALLATAERGISELIAIQRQALGEVPLKGPARPAG
ncbi:MAG: ribonuclease PH [Vicinamibacteria bacterium]|nr:ribonuclease PH [Vicinamibacteria bacterium]